MEYYHLAELVHRQADKYEKKTALLEQNKTGKWHSISWRELSGKVIQTARAMAEFGIKEQDNIGIYSQNMPACFFYRFWSVCQPGRIRTPSTQPARRHK